MAAAESGDRERLDRLVARASALVDEIANELDTWPGVRIERRSDGAALVRYAWGRGAGRFDA
jgi:hypothetical protein